MATVWREFGEGPAIEFSRPSRASDMGERRPSRASDIPCRASGGFSSLGRAWRKAEGSERARPTRAHDIDDDDMMMMMMMMVMMMMVTMTMRIVIEAITMFMMQ